MWIVCITSVRHVLTVNGYGGRQTKENEKSWCFKGWETLVPNYHYIEIKPDFSDLEERLQYYMAHTDEAQAIIEHAHEYIEQFKNKKREQLISLLVLEKYFKMTGQL